MNTAQKLLLLSPNRRDMRRLLFNRGENGVITYPSMFSSLFKVSDGTDPVTADGDAVGYAFDQSGNGNHPIQATAGSRPVVWRRRNWLIKTEDFTNGAWIFTNITPVNAALVGVRGPLASLTAIATVATATPQQLTAPATSAYTYTLEVRQGSAATDMNAFAIYNTTTGLYPARCTVNLTTGAVTTITGTCTATSLGSGSWLVTLKAATGISAGDTISVYTGVLGGSVTAGKYVYVGTPQLEFGSTATRYQSVDTATVYATDPFAEYLYFTGGTKSLVSTFAASLGTDCTVAYAVPGVGATILTAQTITTTYTQTVDHAGLIVVNRALTATETRYVTDYLNSLALV